MLPSSVVIPHGMTPAQRHGTLWHPCPDCALCITPGRLYDPTSCPPCQTFLADMRQNPSPSSLARKTWVKWNRTLVNRWKKKNVALYSPSNVRMLLWADATLFSSYEAVLPPAPPARSASKESLLSAGRSTTSPAPPGDDGGDQDRSSPWSGFDDELPPNQEVGRHELAPGPSSLPLPTQPPSDPTLAMLMNMMSTFQSEMKSLRSDLSGSVSSMVAEAVAAQLPQVFLILFVQALLNFCHILLAILPLHIMSLFPSSPCPVVPNFGVSLFHQALPNPAPPAMPPHPTLPWPRNLPGFPNRDCWDPTTPRFWLVILFFHIALTCLAAICLYTCLIVFLIVVIQHSFLRIGSYDPHFFAS